jgi:hypothetical protein
MNHLPLYHSSFFHSSWGTSKLNYLMRIQALETIITETKKNLRGTLTNPVLDFALMFTN